MRKIGDDEYRCHKTDVNSDVTITCTLKEGEVTPTVITVNRSPKSKILSKSWKGKWMRTFLQKKGTIVTCTQLNIQIEDSGDFRKFRVFLTLGFRGEYYKSSLRDNTIKPNMPRWTDVTITFKKEKKTLNWTFLLFNDI